MIAFIILSYIFCCIKSNSWNVVGSITHSISVKANYTLREYPNSDRILMIKTIDQNRAFQIKNITINQKKLAQDKPRYLNNTEFINNTKFNGSVYPQIFLTSIYQIVFFYMPNILIIYQQNQSTGSKIYSPFDLQLSLINLENSHKETYFYAVNNSQKIIKFRLLRNGSNYTLDLIGSVKKINTKIKQQKAFMMEKYYCIYGLLYNSTNSQNQCVIQCYYLNFTYAQSYHTIIDAKSSVYDIFPQKNKTSALILQNKTSVGKLQFHFNTQSSILKIVFYRIDIIQSNQYLSQVHSLWIISEKQLGLILPNSLGIKICIFSILDKKATLYQILKINSTENTVTNIYSLKDNKTNLFIFEMIDGIHQALLYDRFNEEEDRQVYFEIIFWVIIFIVIFLIKIKIFKSTQIQLFLKQLIRTNQYIIQLTSIIFIYLYTFLIALQTQSNKNDVQLGFLSSFSDDRLIGSFYLRLHHQMFLFLTIITVIYEVYHENEYSNTFLTYHCKHGLRITTFMIYQLSRISVKASIHAIISTFYILLLQKIYCCEEYQVLEINFQMFQMIIVFYFCMISLVVIAIILSKLLNSYSSSLMIFLFISCCLSYYTQIFTLQNTITNLQQAFVFLWPATFFSSFSQNLYKSQLRFASQNESQFSMIIVATVLSYLLQSIYIAIIGYNYNKINFNSLVKIKISSNNVENNRESVSRNNTIITSKTFRLFLQKEDNLLQVFIPRKLNLKGRLEKNKVLEDIKFAANKGQIISFIDIENQSKKALMKILINDQKSDTTIEQQLQGIIQYSQSVKLSYCFDKDIYFSELTIRQNLQLFNSFKNPTATKQQSKEQVQKMIEIFDIPHNFSEQKAKNLSGGSLKKMCLACSLIGNPSVVFLQDPSVGLDTAFQKRFWEKLVKLKEDKLIIIFTTNAEEVVGISDKIWYFEDAKIRKQQQLRRKRKLMEIQFEVFDQNSYLRCLNYVNQVKKTQRIFDITKSSSQILDYHRISMSLYDFQDKKIFEILKRVMKKINSQNNLLQKQQWCHFSFRIIQRMMNISEIRKLIKTQTKLLKNSGKVSRQFLQTIQRQFDKDEFSNTYISLSESQRQNEKGQETHLFERFNNIHKNMKFNQAFYQIKALFLRKRYFYKNPQSRKWLFIPQLLIQVYLFSKLLISSGQFVPINSEDGQIMSLIIITWLLQTKIFHLYSHDRSVGILQYYKCIGLSEINYWIGSFLFDLFANFIPFFINIIIVIAITSIFSIKFNGFQFIWTSLLFGIGHLLFTIILCQFISSQTNIQAIIISFIAYYVYVGENANIKMFLEKDGLYDVLGYFFYPITIKILSQNQFTSPFIQILFGQYFIMITAIILLIHLKNRKQNKQTQLIYQNNLNNSFIQNEKIQIDNIIDNSEQVLGYNLTHSYKSTEIIKNIYFKAQLGQIVGFFGPNGCGKTTIFKIIMNLINQNSGYLQYFGKRKKQLCNKGRLDIGCCPQFDQLDYNLTVQQNARTVGAIKGWKDSEISKFIAIFMRYLRFQGNQSVLVSDLSVSERKKTNFMISFIGFPTILVMDQTSTGLDPQNSKRCLNLLRQYSHKYEKIVFFTSHNLKQGEQYCDKVYILKNGVLTASGLPYRLKNGQSQQLYKLIIYLSRSENEYPRNKNREKIKEFINQVQFKKFQFENNFTICYSFDMLKVDLNRILDYCLKIYEQKVIEQFQLFKYGMIEVAMYHTRNASALENQSNSIKII